MTSDPKKRLEAHGSSQVDPIDANFADRLESGLRHQHVSERATGRRRAAAFFPRLVIAGLLALVGLAGAFALTRSDDGVPVAVVDSEPIAPAAQPGTADDTNPDPAVDLTATPRPRVSTADSPAADALTPVSPTLVSPTLVPPTLVPPTVGPPVVESPANEPTPVAVDPNPIVEPSVTPVVVNPTPTADASAATATPSPVPTTPTSTTPTSTAPTSTAPTSTAPTPVTPIPTQPIPTPTVVQAATAVPLPTSTTAPTATPEPAITPLPIELTCGSRQTDTFVAAVCAWTDPGLDGLTHYELLRSINGSNAAVVVRQRAVEPTNYVDRDVQPGDVAVYLVAGLSIDGTTLAASVRERVELPPG